MGWAIRTDGEGRRIWPWEDTNPFIDLEELQLPYAHITRTNMGAIRAAIEAVENGLWISKTSAKNDTIPNAIHLLQSVYWLMNSCDRIPIPNKPSRAFHKDIQEFESFYELLEEAKTNEALSWVVSLVRKEKTSVLDLIETIESRLAKTKEQKQNSVFITTAHKSKGLEFDRVRLDGDFLKIPAFAVDERPIDMLARLTEQHELVRLMYVALTRAKQQVVLSFPFKLLLDNESKFPMSPWQRAKHADRKIIDELIDWIPFRQDRLCVRVN